MEFDSEGRMYIMTSAKGNVDPDAFRTRMKRFSGMLELKVEPVSFIGPEAELFAEGLRNENGLAFQGVNGTGFLYGVENDRDMLNVPALGGRIDTDNPAEELNRFDVNDPGRFYGYPYCFTEYNIPTYGEGRGSQWANPEFPDVTNEWCRDPANNRRPVLELQGHSAPLGLDFYRTAAVSKSGALPASWEGDLFVGYHGSWNRQPSTGYKVVRIVFDDEGNPTDEIVTLFSNANPSPITGERWGTRPVAVKIGPDGRMYISSDASGEVIVFYQK
jgi:glucose/arabinose dehydrogenase